MKRYLLFAWNGDERAGGWVDFVDSFDSAFEALQHYNAHEKGLFKDFFDIVDTQSGDRGAVLNPNTISSWSGYESDKPCIVCGEHLNNESEPRFGYTVCEKHHEASMWEINACNAKKEAQVKGE